MILTLLIQKFSLYPLWAKSHLDSKYFLSMLAPNCPDLVPNTQRCLSQPTAAPARLRAGQFLHPHRRSQSTLSYLRRDVLPHVFVCCVTPGLVSRGQLLPSLQHPLLSFTLIFIYLFPSAPTPS